MRLVLACAADVPDFDLWAQVLMVQPDGSAVRLGEDIRRARFRNSPFKQQFMLAVEKAKIELSSATSTMCRKAELVPGRRGTYPRARACASV